MPAGPISIDTWSVDRLSEPHIFDLFSADTTSDHRLAIVTDADIIRLAPGVPIRLENENRPLFGRFTDLAHLLVFSCPLTCGDFEFGFVLLDRTGKVAWDLMLRCVDISTHAPMSTDGLPEIPLIVTHVVSKKIYRAVSVLHQGPSEFEINVNSWGAEKQKNRCMTLSAFYREKSNIELKHDQCVMVGEMGSPVKPEPLVMSSQMTSQRVIETNPSSLVYLVPQILSLHPINPVMKSLEMLPRILFELESSIIADRIVKDLLLPSNDTNLPELVEFFMPRELEKLGDPVLALASVALTCPSASRGFNYEYLEWLGDSVFRFVAAIEGCKDSVIRENFFQIMTNDHIGSAVSTAYPDIHTRYVWSRQATLKAPQTCRSRLMNFNILADVTEALFAVSFIAGGIASVLHTASQLGIFSHPVRNPQFMEMPAFISAALKPACLRLEASLQLVRDPRNRELSIGQLNELRDRLLRSISPTIESTTLFRNYCQQYSS